MSKELDTSSKNTSTTFAKINLKTLMLLIIGVLLLLQCISIFANNIFPHLASTIVPIANIISIVLIILLIISYKLMMSSMKDIINSADNLYKGNLNINDIIIYENSDFKLLAKTFNSMKSNLLYFVENTKKIVTALSSSFTQVSTNMNSTVKGNEEIANSMQAIAVKAQKESDIVTNYSSMMNTIYDSINNIAEKINYIEHTISDLNKNSTSAYDNLNLYDKDISEISSSMTNTKDFIDKLKNGISQITGVTEFISEISEQLKLLSLNASIEAARCGEAGKGFAVVATEITNLSETTKEGINRINDFTSHMLKNSNNVENSINISIDKFEKGHSTFSNAKGIFEGIQVKNSEILSDVENMISEITTITNVVDKSKQLNEDLQAASDSITEDTSNVSAVSEQLFSQFQEINQIVNSLNGVITKLEKSAQIFNTGVKPIDTVSKKALKIAIMISGSTTSAFWKEVAQGAQYASKELQNKNATVELIRVPVGNSMDEHRDYFIDLLSKCIDEKFDGICLLGNFEELIPLVNKAADNGIPVMTLNSDFHGKSKRIACIQQNQYQSGAVAAEAINRELNGKGNIIIVDYKEKLDSQKQRIKGFKDELKKYKGIKIIDSTYAGNSLEETRDKFIEYLKTHNNIDAIYYTARFKFAIAEAIEALHLQNKVHCIVYDVDASTLNYIKNGALSCAIGQDPFGQGHNPVIYMYNHLVTKQKPASEKLWTRIDVINNENVDSFLS